MDAAVSKAERIEVGGEMADDAIGSDQHQSADRILRRSERRGRRHLEAGNLCAALDLVADRTLGFAVVAGQCADEIAIGAVFVEESGKRRGPSGTTGIRSSRRRRLLHAFEKSPPLVADRARIALVLSLHILDVGRVRSAQKGSAQKRFILAISCHEISSLFMLRERCLDALDDADNDRIKSAVGRSAHYLRRTLRPQDFDKSTT